MSLREDLNRFWNDPDVRWVVGLSIVAFVAYALWSYHRTIINVALLVLIPLAAVLDETTWRFWVILLAGLVWLYAYRKNRRRQEVIIELLLEIRRKLG